MGETVSVISERFAKIRASRTPEEWAEFDRQLAQQRAESDARHIQAQIDEQVRTLPRALRTGFDLALHPCPRAHAEVMAWEPGRTGLMLFGPTGTGKTRSLVSLIQRLLTERQIRSVEYWPAPALADVISARSFENICQFENWLHRIERAELLVLDDLGAHRTTERVAAAFHRIIDFRYSQGLPLLSTTNAAPGELQAKLQDEHGRTIRRLQEMTHTIEFL